MDLEKLKQLIKNGETENIEFKKTTAQQRQGTKAICGMLNHIGGFVFYGIDDKGNIKGQEVTKKTLEKLISEHRLIFPMPHLEIETASVSKKMKVIAVKVPKNQGLFHYENRAYLRNGPTTSIMPIEEYTERLMEKRHSYQRWENEYAPEEFTIQDLDEEEIKVTLYNGIKLGRIKSKKNADTKSILRGLKLFNDSPVKTGRLQ